MDTGLARRAVREASLAGAVVVVVGLCALVVAVSLVSPWVSGWGEPVDGVCRGVTAPAAVVEDMITTGSEGSGATASRSWLPWGPTCTWTLSDRRTVSKPPSWDSTLGAAGAVAVAAGAVSLLIRSSRRGRGGADRDRPDGRQ